MRPTTAPHPLKLVALLLFCLLPSIAAAQVPEFDSLYVFGDSLADNGNILIQTKAMQMNPPVPPSVTPHRTYFDGRFSNGYIAFEYLWQRLSGHQPGSALGMKPFLGAPLLQKTGAVDFAFGGTGTPYLDQTPGGFYAPGLKGQVELFRLALRGRKPSSRSLYVVATGANDYRIDPFNVPMNPVDVVHNIEEAIGSLYQLGARHVMVVDLPDLGAIPANGGDPAATELSNVHNGLLDEAISRLRAKYPSLHVIPVRLNPLFQDLSETMEAHAPELAVFAPADPGLSACLFIDPATCHDAPAFLFNASYGFIFWDVAHPTTEAHRHLGDYAYDQLVNEYE
jgi:phospholipase/lecithinase/hemolysin